MVAVGDSHIYMWFPALNAIASAAKWKLVVLVDFTCPLADTTVWNPLTNSNYTECPIWRAAMIKRINNLDPALIVMSETIYPDNGQDQPITLSEWTADQKKTWSSLDSLHTKKVLIGYDIPVPNVPSCLAVNPTDIQVCSLVSTSREWSSRWKKWAGERLAEKKAAEAKGITYVDQVPWECSARCTQVIGNMIPYFTDGHISATYATYLTKVLQAALAKDMSKS